MPKTRDVARPAVATITAYSQGSMGRPRARRGRGEPVVKMQVDSRVWDVVKELRLPESRLEIISATEVIIHNR